MIFILDAYNVIHKIKSLERLLDKDLRAAREGLISLCGRLASERGDISKIILVFDGRSEFWNSAHPSLSKIDLIFSETNEDADERIITVLEQLPAKSLKCVVSDDNFVRNQARSHETRVMPVTEFEALAAGRGKKAQSARKSGQDAPALSSKIAAEITAAYKKELGLR